MYTCRLPMKFLISAIAAAGIAAAATASPSIQLVAPRAGAVLDGGSETTLQWSAASLPEHVEEWEAFLSLDDGRYYSVRLTPHLDAGIRSFSWHVPNVVTTHARILLRVGDERDERIIEFPQTFRIVPGPLSIDLHARAGVSTEDRGEPALPEAPAVVQWVTGDRSGAGLVTYRHKEGTTVTPLGPPPPDENIPFASPPTRTSLLPSQDASSDLSARMRPCGGAPSLLLSRPLLLLATRLNI